MKIGVMANINQQIDYETAAKVATALGWETSETLSGRCDNGPKPTSKAGAEAERSGCSRPGPPVVTIMGHVDHGKTKLLDAIRSANVAEGEAGGITQHIGAYQIETQGRKITFLDTPGHEAFTAMRARGAQATDIAVLVVAADDGVMPTTLEAIAHIKRGQRADRRGDQQDRPPGRESGPRQAAACSELNVMPEEWGGDVPIVEVSAREKLGLDDLLEVLLLVADVTRTEGEPAPLGDRRRDRSQVDRNRGPVATVLIQSGTLNLRDVVVAGATWGRDQGDVRRPRQARSPRPSQVRRSRSWVCWMSRRLGDTVPGLRGRAGSAGTC